MSLVKQAYFDKEITEKEIITNIFPKWVQQNDYGLLCQTDWTRPVGVNTYLCNYKFMKLAKRGNDVYANRVKQRFAPLSLLCSSNKNVNLLQRQNGDTGYANIIWCTLTYDTKRCSKTQAWSNIGHELNDFLKRVRQKYGKIQVLRNFESFKNGYPHIHMIIIFEDYSFQVTKYKYKRGKRAGEPGYILISEYQNKKGNNKPDRRYLEGFWHSWSSFSAVFSLGAVGYTLKYVTKELYRQNNYSTSARLWLYHKQSYSISRGFVPALNALCESHLVTNMRNYHTISNFFDKWGYLGACELNKSVNKWSIDFKDRPPPDFIGRNTDLCRRLYREEELLGESYDC